MSESHSHAQNVRAQHQSEASVNMAEGMENAGSRTVSGSKEAMAVPKNFKDLRKRFVRNIAQYNAANVPRIPFPAGVFLPTFTSSILSAMFTGMCDPPEKLSLALMPRSFVLRMIVQLAYRELICYQ